MRAQMLMKQYKKKINVYVSFTMRNLFNTNASYIELTYIYNKTKCYSLPKM